MMSPPGASILITSAPRSPRICVASGPRTTVVRSSTLVPASGPGLASLTASPETSSFPLHQYSIVERHHFGPRHAMGDDGSVACQQGEALGTRLRNQHSVERVA